MPNLHNSKKTTEKEAFIASWCAMQNDPVLDMHEINYWLQDNMNDGCALFLGHRGRPIDDSGIFDYAIEIDDNKPFLIMFSAWGYEHYGFAPDVPGLSVFLPDVAIELDTREPDDGSLDIVITLDLFKWRNLVPNAIGVSLFFALVCDKTDETKKAVCLQQAKELLALFYPTISMDFLNMAADLGVVTADDRDFIEWFVSHLQCREEINEPILPTLSSQ